MINNLVSKHLTDQEFYTYIKFLSFLKESSLDTGGMELTKFRIGTEELSDVFNRIFVIDDQVPRLRIDIERNFEFEEQLNKAKEESLLKPPEEREIIEKILIDIKDNKKTTLDDIAIISWVWYEIYSKIIFAPVNTKSYLKLKTALNLFIDNYLEALINDKLIIAKKNYYNFETQKKTLIKLIEEGKKIDLYGNNFIISLKIDSKAVATRIPDFCLVQAVYSLQKLGYLQVLDVWQDFIYPEESFAGPKNRYLNANIIIEEVFVEEINDSYKKNNPVNVFEEFDATNGILKFAGKEIELSKKGKETDSVLLLKSLLKKKNTNWKHNDEILSEWGYDDEDQKKIPKNKIYFAGQKINKAVAIKTQIEDFILCNTSKARINPKYRKVDE